MANHSSLPKTTYFKIGCFFCSLNFFPKQSVSAKNKKNTIPQPIQAPQNPGKTPPQKTCILSREFGASRIPVFWHRAFAQEMARFRSQNGHVDRAIASGDILRHLQK